MLCINVKPEKIYKRVSNHTLLALNSKTQFGLPDPNDTVLEERIEWNRKSNRERKRGSSFRVLMLRREKISSMSLVKNNKIMDPTFKHECHQKLLN